MTVTDQLNDILDRLDADASPDIYEIAEILKVLISNIEISHAQLKQQIRQLESRVQTLEKKS
jgi:hypothetical protein